MRPSFTSEEPVVAHIPYASSLVVVIVPVAEFVADEPAPALMPWAPKPVVVMVPAFFAVAPPRSTFRAA